MITSFALIFFICAWGALLFILIDVVRNQAKSNDAVHTNVSTKRRLRFPVGLPIPEKLMKVKMN
jgi:predicted secreted protein